jgi:hypothetical protein
LRRLVGFRPEVQIEADTVTGGISTLCRDYPQLRTVLLDASGQLRGVHRLALNRTMLGRSELGARVGDDDVVEVVTTLAGG